MTSCPQKTTPTTVQSLLMAALLALPAFWSGAAQAQNAYASATVQGALAPGVYGRIDIGNAPPPPLIYSQPVIIQRPAVYVRQQPLYLHVPPGHAKKWSKHCASYNACNRPVYFANVRGDDAYERRRNLAPAQGFDNGAGPRHGPGPQEFHGKGHGNGNGHGKGHGHGHGRD